VSFDRGFDYGKGDAMADSFRSSTPIAVQKISTQKIREKSIKID